MSLIRWMIISTIITLPLMFILPGTPNDQDSERIMAGLQLNDACSNALVNGCTLDGFRPVYSQCIEIYGNITLEECRSRCCDTNGTQNFQDLFNFTTPKT